MQKLFKKILAGDPEIKTSLNFFRKDYADFEKQYSDLIKTMDGFNPSLPENSSKSAEFRKGMDKMIETWGTAPIILYNEYYFKNRAELDSFSKREEHYKACDDFISEFQKFANVTDNPDLFKDKTHKKVIVKYTDPNGVKKERELDFNYPAWEKDNEKLLGDKFTLEQKQALFAAQVLIGQKVGYEAKAPFCTTIKAAEGSGLYGDCTTLSALYIVCLSALKGKNQESLFPEGSLEYVKYCSHYPGHVRVQANKSLFEPTAVSMVPPDNDKFLLDRKLISGNKFMLADMVPDNNEGARYESVTKYVKLHEAKYQYILVEDKREYRLHEGKTVDVIDYNLSAAYNDSMIELEKHKDFKAYVQLVQESKHPVFLAKVEESYIGRVVDQLSYENYYEAYKLARESSSEKIMDILLKPVSKVKSRDKMIEVKGIPEEELKKCKNRYDAEISNPARKKPQAPSIQH